MSADDVFYARLRDLEAEIERLRSILALIRYTSNEDEVHALAHGALERSSP